MTTLSPNSNRPLNKGPLARAIRAKSSGDQHLGHHRTTTEEMLPKLSRAFCNDEELKDLDVIFFPGDLFDRLLNLNLLEVYLIRAWFASFLVRLERNNVKLKIVEGTPSHDWRQTQLLLDTMNAIGSNADVHYADSLQIEFDDLLGPILYIPDEWMPETDDTWRQVQQLLQEHQIEKVNFIVMHGAMEFHFPDVAHGPVHSSDRYRSICRNLILIGHVHTAVDRDRVLGAGSFDRLKHNEEEDKGHYNLTAYPDGTYKATFIPTEDAKVFITLDCYEETLSESLTTIHEKVKDLPDGSYVKVRTGPYHPLAMGVRPLRSEYPLLNIEHAVRRDKDVREPHQLESLFSEGLEEPVAVTESNVVDILTARLRFKNVSSDDITCAEALLNELLSGSG